MDKKTPLVVDGHVLGSTGYAQLTRGIVFGLDKTGLFNIRILPRDWVNLGDVEDLNEEETEIVRKALNNRTLDPSKSIFLSLNVASNFKPLGRSKCNFGFSMLETDRISRVWAGCCNLMDAVFVPTDFNKGTFKDSGVSVPVVSVPLGADPSYFNLEFEDQKKYSFISTPFNFIFNGQWAAGDRKGVNHLLKAFLETFKGSTRVGLILKVFHSSSCTADFLSCQSMVRQMKSRLKAGELPKIYVIHGKLSRKELAQLYYRAQVLVLPSLGESWGLPLHEAIFCGLPVITTRGSGPDYYLDFNLTRFLNSRVSPLPRPLLIPHLYEGDMRMTYPDYDDLKDALSDSYHRYPLWKERALQQREKIKHLTWDNTAQGIVHYWEETLGIF